MYPGFRAGLRLRSLVRPPSLRIQPSPLILAGNLKYASASTSVKQGTQSYLARPQGRSDAGKKPPNAGKKPADAGKPLVGARKRPHGAGRSSSRTEKKLSGSRGKHPDTWRQSSGAGRKPAGNGGRRFKVGRKSTLPVVKRQSGSGVRPEPNPGGFVHNSTPARVKRLQRRIDKIRTRILVLILHLKQTAKFLGIGDDNLHTLRHCIRTLQLDTFSSLQGTLESLKNTPAAQQGLPDSEAYAVWSESKIPAVHIWAVKSMFKALQIPELETEEARLGLKVRIGRAWAEILNLNTLMKQFRAVIKLEASRRASDSLKANPAMETYKEEDIREDIEGDIDMPSANPQESQSIQNNLDPNNSQLFTSQSILLKNLAAVVAQTKRESAIWKIERFLSRLEEVYTRIPKITQLLDQLAQELQVDGYRRHPLVVSQHTLQLDTLSSLDLTLRIVRKRTPKDALELPQGVVTAVWYEAKISEVQLDVVKGWMRSFYESTKEMQLSRQQKDQIRSIRGRLKIVHGLIRSSREDFGSLGPKSGFDEPWRRILAEENKV